MTGLKPNNMKNKFIILTTIDDQPIIIGIVNVAFIETDEKNPVQTKVTFNFARNIDLWPKTIIVKENFAEVKSMLGL